MKERFSSFVQSFFSVYLPVTIGASKNTINSYKYSMLIFVRFLKSKKIDTDNILLTDITFNLIEEYIEYLKNDKKNQNSSINSKIAALKSFFKYIQLKTLVNFDCCEKVRKIPRLKEVFKLPEYLNTDETKILLETIKQNNNIKHLTMIALLYDGALRVQELCNLKVKNLNFNKRYLEISIINSKGGSSRVVAVSDEMKEIVKQYLKNITLLPNEFLFKNKYDNQYTREGINYILKKYYQLSKGNCDNKEYFTKRCHPHMLRHSRAIDMLESGVDEETIKQYLGHKNTSTTQIYARISSQKIAKIIEEHSKKVEINLKRSKKEKNDLETWLTKNI